MKTKYFMAKITKGQDNGKIVINVETVHYYERGTNAESTCSVTLQGSNAGWSAPVFDTDKVPIHEEYNLNMRKLTWEADHVSISSQKLSFKTGSEAQQYLQALREKLVVLDHHVDHLAMEIDALEA